MKLKEEVHEKENVIHFTVCCNVHIYFIRMRDINHKRV